MFTKILGALALTMAFAVPAATASAAPPPVAAADILPHCVTGLGPTGNPAIDCPDFALELVENESDYATETGAKGVTPIDSLLPRTVAGVAITAEGAIYLADNTTARILGIHIPNVFKIARCTAALITFVASNLFLAGKIRKAGGIVKVAKRLVKSRDIEAAISAILGVSAEIAGIDQVVQACG